MDGLMKLSRETQAVLGGGLLLLILSFFNWQEVSIGPYSAGVTEWHGIGFLAVLLVIAMLAWEVVRVMGANISLGTLSPGLVSAGLALLAAVFTVIAFLAKGDFRTWVQWVALLVALLVGAAAVMRARTEGVQMPQMPQSTSGGSAGSADPPASAGSAEPPASAGPAEPMDGSSE